MPEGECSGAIQLRAAALGQIRQAGQTQQVEAGLRAEVIQRAKVGSQAEMSP